MIPWTGDIVVLNPDGSSHPRLGTMRSVFGTNEIRVTSACVSPSDPNLVTVNVTYGFALLPAEIRLPEGRFFCEPIGAPSMFTLVKSAMESHPFYNGQRDPAPVPGDKIAILGEVGRYTLLACDCEGDPLNNWPHGKMECGAHWNGGSGIKYNVWPAMGTGWLCDGLLFRAGAAQAAKAWDATALKVANTRTDARVCAKCSGSLKDPGMGPTYKHCPRCEP